MDSESGDEGIPENRKQYNKFQLLHLVDETDSVDPGDDEDYDCGESDEKSDHDCKITLKDRPSIINTKQKCKSKRRRNRGKSTKKNNNRDEGDDIESKLQIINTEGFHQQNSREESDALSRFKILKVELRNLQPEAELKKIFGKSVVREDRTRYKSHPGSNLQRSRFVSSGYYEIKSGSSISGPKMDIDEFYNDQAATTVGHNMHPSKISPKPSMNFNSDQPIYFKFTHDKSYQEAHKLFLEAVNRGHPESIVQNLSIYPLHAESLIQLSHMVRVSEDYKTASEFIERALLVYERGFHPRFNLATASCRLSYRRPENRAFFIAIFKHIIYCNRRGLRRTPLEYSKLLLSLEPENDPLLSSQLLDFFSIRSEEYDFLIEFNAKWTHLSKLPNMNFSVALAYFLKSRSAKISKLEGEDICKVANQRLRKALLLFPNFLIPLLEACTAEPNAELRKCKYFDYSVYSNNYKQVPEIIDVLVNIYVKRNYILWKPKHVLNWLETVVSSMVDEFTHGQLVDSNLCIEHWSEFKKPVPRNLLRHIVMSDLDLKIPPSATSTTFLDIDPYPPTESIISYDPTPTRAQNPVMQASSSTFGASGLFLRSILPSFSFVTQGTQTSSRTERANENSGFSIDDYVLENELAEAGTEAGNEPAGFDELQDAIRGVADSIAGLLSLRPLIMQNRDRRDSTDGRDGSDPNDQNNERSNANQ